MPAKRLDRFRYKQWSTLWTLIGINGVFLVLNAFVLFKFYVYQTPPPNMIDFLLQKQPAAQPIDFKDFISLILSALSVQLAVLGIGAAIIAIWGYGTIKEGAINAATEIVRAEIAQANAERQSTAQAEEQVEKLGDVTQDNVQKLVEALIWNERGTNGTPGEPGSKP